MKLVTAQQMRELDRAAIETHGVPSLELMERAGAGVAEAVARRCGPGEGTICIVAGRGNNGGDGLVAARHLIAAGHDVTTLLLASPAMLTPDARTNWERLAPMTTHVIVADGVGLLASQRPQIAMAAVVVDAVLGTGLDRPVEGLAVAAIEAITSARGAVVAVDIPSGLSADSGAVLGRAVRARETITFGLPKRGCFLGEGPAYAGRVQVIDIGIPPEAVHAVKSDLELIDGAEVAATLPARARDAHKGTHGHVAIFAGSRGHLGAGYLASLAALRAGCGLATYALPERAFAKFDARYPEIMCDPLPDAGTAAFHPEGVPPARELAKRATAVGIGPAVGTAPETAAFVNAIVRECERPIVVDADGLNVLEPDAVRARRAPTLLTPHPGEAGRLLGIETAVVQADRLGGARRLAREMRAIALLKGAGTIVAHPDGRAAINPTGSAGMATAGMGDALTGIAASLLAQGMEPWNAACAAVFLHGRAGEIAAEEHTERALITTDLIRAIGRAFREIGRAT